MKKRMTGGSFLIAAIILAVIVTVVKSYGMDMGGFDVEVGDGSYEDGNFQGWEEPPPEQVPSEPIWEEEVPQEQMPPEQIWWDELPQEQIPPESIWWDERPSEQIPSEPAWQEQPSFNQTWENTAPVSTVTPVPTAVPTPTATPTPRPTITPTSLPVVTPTFAPTPMPTVTPCPRRESFTYYKKQEDGETHQKDYPVKFINDIKVEKGQNPEIEVESKGSVQILSLRVNEKECPWHWEDNKIVIDGEVDGDECKVEILAFSHGGKLIKIRF